MTKDELTDLRKRCNRAEILAQTIESAEELAASVRKPGIIVYVRSSADSGCEVALEGKQITQGFLSAIDDYVTAAKQRLESL